MDDRKILLCYCGVASFDDGQVIEASFTEARIAWRCISHDHCPWCDRRFYKTSKGGGKMSNAENLADMIEDSYGSNVVVDVPLDESDRKLIVAALRAQAGNDMVAAERARCLAICEGWLSTYGTNEIQYTSAREYAVDAISDIADLIRDGDYRGRRFSRHQQHLRGQPK